MPAKPQKLNILMADDQSEHAAAAASLLCDLPLTPRSSIYVLRVFSVSQTGNVWLFEHALEKTIEKLTLAGHHASGDVALGSPAPKILEIADQQNADLIVMGSVGLRATLGIMLGGVAQQVVEYAPAPVLVVRKPYEGMRHVLIATDGSDCSQTALKFVKRFPFPAGVRFSLMHVLPPEFSPTNLAWTDMMDIPLPPITPEDEAYLARIAAEEREDGQALLESTTKALKSLEIPMETVMPRGDAATEIINFAKNNAVDMIVVGSRGLGAMRGWLMGSVSRKLLHYAPCSVLVVKACD